jgi:hypothetical protein
MMEEMSKKQQLAYEATTVQLSSLQSGLAKAQETFDGKIGELAKAHDELKNRFDSVVSQLGEVEKGLKTLESSTALKKSADLGGLVESPVVKSVWADSVFSVRN